MRERARNEQLNEEIERLLVPATGMQQQSRAASNTVFTGGLASLFYRTDPRMQRPWILSTSDGWSQVGEGNGDGAGAAVRHRWR